MGWQSFNNEKKLVDWRHCWCPWLLHIQLPRHVFVFTGAWKYEISRGVLISASHNLLTRQLSLITSSHTSNQMTVPHAPLFNMVSKASHLHWHSGEILADILFILINDHHVPRYRDLSRADWMNIVCFSQSFFFFFSIF